MGLGEGITQDREWVQNAFLHSTFDRFSATVSKSDVACLEEDKFSVVSDTGNFSLYFRCLLLIAEVQGTQLLKVS